MNDKPLIVDPQDSSCFATLNEAIADALDGEKIMVKPGDYRENLIVDKQIYIIGDGAMDDIRIIGDGVTPVISSQSPLLNLRNLTLINSSSTVPTIECASGICDVKYCAMQGGYYGVTGLSGSRISVDNSSVTGAANGGIYGCECIGVTVADTLIEKCKGIGIVAEECQELFVERATIMDVTPHGILCTGDGAFEVKDTEIIGVPSAPISDNGVPAADEMERIWYERREVEEDE
ncbi:right-handed parallel beta-helix repeat-containing protein [bacterium]|nr:right-handed parallel beta-helix repeat-containing protein [bacterium]MBU1636263.1 right-handed parallel beta-helix repeat-containing protein [bacterium]MBU1920255.1 right-handed parallel beta-helix repeat-containing protein [bacterium]